MPELYKAIAGSPITYLAADISANQTTISIADDTALPDAPNICTIGYGENIETIRYGAKSNGVLQNVTRGLEGTPRAWKAGTEVARFYTAYEHNAIVETIKSHLADYETHKAEYETFTTVSTTRNRLRVVEGSIFAQKIGKLVIITFEYDPSLSPTGFSKYDINILTVNNFKPKYKVAGSAYPDSSVDINHRIVPYIIPNGAIGVVNNLSNNTDSGAWTCTLVYLTD